MFSFFRLRKPKIDAFGIALAAIRARAGRRPEFSATYILSSRKLAQRIVDEIGECGVDKDLMLDRMERSMTQIEKEIWTGAFSLTNGQHNTEAK